MDRMFNFGGRAQALQDIKWLTDDQFKTRVFNFNHDVSPGDMPSETFGVTRSLPLRNEVYQGEGSYGKKRGLVMNHGTIVSAVNIFPDVYYASQQGEASIGVSGEMKISTNVLGNPINVQSQDSFRMYGNGCVSLLVPANGGGAAVQDKYSALDVSYGRLNAAGAAITAGDSVVDTAGSAQTRAKNIPIGITQMTVWRDDVGETLNYSEKVVLLESIQSDYFIKVPVVLVDRAYGILSAGPQTATPGANAMLSGTPANNGFGNSGVHAAYAALAKWYAFAYMNEDDLIYGAYVKSDPNGMFIPQEGTPANAFTTAQNVQTVGKMFSIDSKFPKENHDMYITFTDTKVTGSDTFGIPADLFIFAMEYIKASGITTPADVWDGIKALINGAAVGHLKINIHVS